MSGPSRVLGMVASACGGLEARFRTELVEPALERGWQPAITLTPTAYAWLETTGELPRLRALCELAVRGTSRMPGEPRPHPDPEVFLFAPASAGSVAKFALGIADSQALTVLGDVLGDPAVTVLLGYQVKDTRAGHPAWPGHLDSLASAGVGLHRLGLEPWTGLLDLLPG